jgi:hypothetical protein
MSALEYHEWMSFAVASDFPMQRTRFQQDHESSHPSEMIEVDQQQLDDSNAFFHSVCSVVHILLSNLCVPVGCPSSTLGDPFYNWHNDISAPVNVDGGASTSSGQHSATIKEQEQGQKRSNNANTRDVVATCSESNYEVRKRTAFSPGV